MAPPTAVHAPLPDAPPKITATHASGGRGRAGQRGRRGARGHGTASDSSNSGTDGGAPSLLSRIGARVDGAGNGNGGESPTTPKAEGNPKNALAIKGASLPPKPGNGNGRRGSYSKKLASLTVGTSAAPAPPLPTAPIANSSDASAPTAEKAIPQSAPPDRPTFSSNTESDRPASALALSNNKDSSTSTRSVSPTPRLSWADETDDDSLPDLDDWMTPALTPSADGEASKDGTAPTGEDEEPTPVATAPPSGPLRERRKRGAGKKNKQLAAKAAENAASSPASTPLATPRDEHPRAASGLEDSVAKLSLGADAKGKEKEAKGKEEGVSTPKADWRSVIPESRGEGAMQLLSALAGSIATSNSTYRTPAQRQAETGEPVVTAAAPPAPAPAPAPPAASPPTAPAPVEVKPPAIPAGPAANRIRPVPSPIPSNGAPPTRPSSSPYNTRLSSQGMNGTHHAHSHPHSQVHPYAAGGRNGYRGDLGDTPITLPKKHARPVITADAITRLARGLGARPARPAGQVEANGKTDGSGSNDTKEGKTDS